MKCKVFDIEENSTDRTNKNNYDATDISITSQIRSELQNNELIEYKFNFHSKLAIINNWYEFDEEDYLPAQDKILSKFRKLINNKLTDEHQIDILFEKIHYYDIIDTWISTLDVTKPNPKYSYISKKLFLYQVDQQLIKNSETTIKCQEKEKSTISTKFVSVNASFVEENSTDFALSDEQPSDELIPNQELFDKDVGQNDVAFEKIKFIQIKSEYDIIQQLKMAMLLDNENKDLIQGEQGIIEYLMKLNNREHIIKDEDILLLIKSIKDNDDFITLIQDFPDLDSNQNFIKIIIDVMIDEYKPKESIEFIYKMLKITDKTHSKKLLIESFQSMISSSIFISRKQLEEQELDEDNIKDLIDISLEKYREECAQFKKMIKFLTKEQQNLKQMLKEKNQYELSQNEFKNITVGPIRDQDAEKTQEKESFMLKFFQLPILILILALWFKSVFQIILLTVIVLVIAMYYSLKDDCDEIQNVKFDQM